MKMVKKPLCFHDFFQLLVLYGTSTPDNSANLAKLFAIFDQWFIGFNDMYLFNGP